jgi:multicomponent Na+:H+ antiporter subunit E
MNLFIAILWMLLHDDWDIISFFSGYLIGIVILFALRRFFPKSFYLYMIFAIVKLFLLFIRELVSSSIVVVRQVIRPKIDINPGIFTLETELEGNWEVTLLALLLNLTPGSVVVEVSPNNRVFYIHAMDIPESKNSVIKAMQTFEMAIKEVTR